MNKLFRVKKEHILDVRAISNYYVEMAFKLGYVFVREEIKDDVYMISTTKTKKAFKIDLIENIEIIEQD